MKKGKKSWSVFPLMTACLLAFSACGAQSDAPAASDADANASSDAAVSLSIPSGQVPSAADITIPDGKTVVIGYLAQNETDEFNVIMSNALKEEAEQYGDKVEVIMSDAQSQAAIQVSQAEDMVVKKPDVVIINAIDREACAPAVDAVVEAGIPVIALNTEVANIDLCTSYVGTDAIESGRFAMEIMAEGLGEAGGTVNLIQGVLGHPGNEDRMVGVQEVVKNYPNITLGATQAADWDRNKAMNISEDWISGGADIAGIIAMNDEMAISASNAFRAAGLDDVKIVGIDAIDEALELVKEGKMYGTVYQDAIGQGAASLDVAVCVALGATVDKEYLIPYEKVTAANVDDYLGKNQ